MRVLCALAVALEHLERDAMHAYTGCEPDAWRRGYILAPTLRVLESAGMRRALDVALRRRDAGGSGWSRMRMSS